MAELMALPDAVESLVSDGDSVALEGFTHLIPFAAGHEIIRQGRRELELIRMTPDLLYDQMIGMGVARRLVFSYGGNPGVGCAAPLSRRDRERLAARDRDRGAQPRRDGQPLRGRRGGPAVRGPARLRRHRPGRAHDGGFIECPFTGERLAGRAGAAARRRDRPRPGGRRATATSQLWGIPGVQKEAILAAQALAGDRRADRRRARAAARRDRDPGLGDQRRRGRRPAVRVRPTAWASPTATTTSTTFWDKMSRDRERVRRVDERARAPSRSRREMTVQAPATAGEIQTVVAARRLRDTRTVFIGVGRPSTAAILARMVHNPDARARLRVRHDRRQAVPRPALDRRRRAGARPPTRSYRFRRCSTTGSGRGGSTSRSSARPRSTATPTSTRR